MVLEGPGSPIEALLAEPTHLDADQVKTRGADTVTDRMSFAYSMLENGGRFASSALSMAALSPLESRARSKASARVRRAGSMR